MEQVKQVEEDKPQEAAEEGQERGEMEMLTKARIHAKYWPNMHKSLEQELEVALVWGRF